MISIAHDLIKRLLGILHNFGSSGMEVKQFWQRGILGNNYAYL